MCNDSTEGEMTVMKEIMTINVIIDGEQTVKGKKGESCMILFHGTADGPYFKGTILPSAVDTQKEFYGSPRTLSARYTFKGTDFEGNSCMLFVENNAEAQKARQLTTRPIIFTDSKALQWIEDAELVGTLVGSPKGVTITISQKD